jgi:uncharacterized coiled-coil protein SlyX
MKDELQNKSEQLAVLNANVPGGLALGERDKQLEQKESRLKELETRLQEQEGSLLQMESKVKEDRGKLQVDQMKLPPFFGQLVKLHLAVKNDRKGVQHYGKVPQATQQRI